MCLFCCCWSCYPKNINERHDDYYRILFCCVSKNILVGTTILFVISSLYNLVLVAGFGYLGMAKLLIVPAITCAFLAIAVAAQLSRIKFVYWVLLACMIVVGLYNLAFFGLSIYSFITKKGFLFTYPDDSLEKKDWYDPDIVELNTVSYGTTHIFLAIYMLSQIILILQDLLFLTMIFRVLEYLKKFPKDQRDSQTQSQTQLPAFTPGNRDIIIPANLGHKEILLEVRNFPPPNEQLKIEDRHAGSAPTILEPNAEPTIQMPVTPLPSTHSNPLIGNSAVPYPVEYDASRDRLTPSPYSERRTPTLTQQFPAEDGGSNQQLTTAPADEIGQSSLPRPQPSPADANSFNKRHFVNPMDPRTDAADYELYPDQPGPAFSSNGKQRPSESDFATSSEMPHENAILPASRIQREKSSTRGISSQMPIFPPPPYSDAIKDSKIEPKVIQNDNSFAEMVTYDEIEEGQLMAHVPVEDDSEQLPTAPDVPENNGTVLAIDLEQVFGKNTTEMPNATNYDEILVPESTPTVPDEEVVLSPTIDYWKRTSLKMLDGDISSQKSGLSQQSTPKPSPRRRGDQPTNTQKTGNSYQEPIANDQNDGPLTVTEQMIKVDPVLTKNQENGLLASESESSDSEDSDFKSTAKTESSPETTTRTISSSESEDSETELTTPTSETIRKLRQELEENDNLHQKVIFSPSWKSETLSFTGNCGESEQTSETTKDVPLPLLPPSPPPFLPPPPPPQRNTTLKPPSLPPKTFKVSQNLPEESEPTVSINRPQTLALHAPPLPPPRIPVIHKASVSDFSESSDSD